MAVADKRRFAQGPSLGPNHACSADFANVADGALPLLLEAWAWQHLSSEFAECWAVAVTMSLSMGLRGGPALRVLAGPVAEQLGAAALGVAPLGSRLPCAECSLSTSALRGQGRYPPTRRPALAGILAPAILS